MHTYIIRRPGSTGGTPRWPRPTHERPGYSNNKSGWINNK